ncbi:amidohydrolase family protein [Pyxidicoccus sp. MSG2]|uniref:amidohydrolase family protein n=1 Tax=Pyxidicoccus sp. MSG2 TaxID=2996790 RepID=UPI0022719DD4|nr:amidohydrolase family protein [Pyxidicoccus sp. MSG2]MCY1023907.1 amidohydrolase family protein [Pyxidicoccus sp. MSG2]
MCQRLCGNHSVHGGEPEKTGSSRRQFLAVGASALGAAAISAISTPALAAPAQGEMSQERGASDRDMPVETGTSHRRYLIRGGAVLSMDPTVGDFAQGDVLIEGKKIIAVGPRLHAPGAAIIDATGMIVMPGFVDTHHHQYQTALRNFLPDGLLFNDGLPHGQKNYLDLIHSTITPLYRPKDAFIAELVASLSQLDAGVTTVVDTSQVGHSPEHTDAVIEGLQEAGRRAVFVYSPGVGPRTVFPTDLQRIRRRYFSSNDQLLSLAMGGEVFDPAFRTFWQIARQNGLHIVSHLVGSLGQETLVEQLESEGLLGPDLEFIHASRLSEGSWQAIAASGATVSLATPIEMTMRHGMPPIQTALDHGVQPALSTDVECTMTADFFTQMRTVFTLQRALINERALNGETNLPDLLTSRDVIRFATVEGARVARLSNKVGSLTPGKEADIILLRADAINVAPLNNVPGAVVTLMERSNVDTVIVAGRIRKWRGALVGVNWPHLRATLEASRDSIFQAAGIQQVLF